MAAKHNDKRIHPGVPHRRIVGGIPCPDIMLAEDFDAVPSDVRTKLASLFGAIHGVAVTRIDRVEEDSARTRLSVEIDGWSPSLHRLAIRYLRDVPKDHDGEINDNAARIAFQNAVVEQVARSHAGMHMGLHAPLPLDIPKRGGGAGAGSKPLGIEMRHLLVDASLPALIAADDEDPVRILKGAIRDLHTQPEDSEGGSFVANGSAMVIECGLGRLVGVDTHIDVKGHPSSFDGLALHVNNVDVPETLLAQAAGRPLRDIVSVHPSLDDRIVRTADTDPSGRGGIIVSLEPSLITFGEVAEAAARWKR